jgi:hypothetical protein
MKATGHSRRLAGASASQDLFALAGKRVAWTSANHTTVTVMAVGSGSIPGQFPFNTNDYIVGLVVKSDGAAAWAANTSGANPYVQGTDRRNHAPDQFSDDTKFVRGVTLTSGAGHKILWKYTDGTTGTANLF